MKKMYQYGLVALTTLGLATGAMATPMTLIINDTNGAATGGWDNWNNDGSLNLGTAGIDEIGTPKVEYLEVDYNNESKLLTEIRIILESNFRQEFDSLFINTSYTAGSQWDAWNYYIIDGLPSNETAVSLPVPSSDGMYSVNTSYDYSLATVANGRPGNPNGIAAASLGSVAPSGFGIPTYDDTSYIITYDFGNGLKIDEAFFVAYSPWCANDVVGGGASVPEPATMLLFGAGLMGLAGFARKRKQK